MENGLLTRINGGGSIIPIINKYSITKSDIEMFLQGVIEDTLMDSYYVLSVMKLMFLMLITNN